MRLFIIRVNKTEYDKCDSIAILAKTKEKAIQIATKTHEIFIDNIYEIEEINIDEESIVLESMRWGSY